MTYTVDPTDLNAPSALGTVASNIQLSINHLGNITSSNLDHYFPPANRKASKEWLAKFARERPYLTSFLLSQIVLSGPPLAFFLITTTTLVTFFILIGLLGGLLGALLFTLLAIGIGLVLLLPVLFFTTVAAVSVWLWGSVIFHLVKRFNNGKVPAMPIDLVGGLAKASGFRQLPGPTGQDFTANPNNAPRGPVENTKEANSTVHPKKLSGTANSDEKGEEDGVTSTTAGGGGL
ncbi:hypothetical protein DV736_g2896, partial [Chaetothyriales sp. CBS 134916]